MQPASQQPDLAKLFTTYSENNQLSLDQALKAFSELNYKPAKKDSQLIFTKLKSRNSEYLTFEQFEFWWKELKSIGSQEYLVGMYVQLWKMSGKIKESLGKDQQQQQQQLVGDNCQGTLMRIGVGNVSEDEEKLIKLRINFKNGLKHQEIKEKQPLRQQLELNAKDLALIVSIKLSKEINQDKCSKDLQQLIKSIITVGTSLHKGTKQFLSRLTFTTKIMNGKAFIIAKVEKTVMEMIVNIIEIVQEYLEKIQPEEEFELKIMKQNDLEELFEAVKSKDPKTALPLLFNNTEIKISTLACRLFSLVAKCKNLEKLDLPLFQGIFAFLVMLKSLKFDMQLKNFSKDDSWLEQYESMMPQPVSYTHLTLPTKRIVQISVVAGSLKKKKHYEKQQVIVAIQAAKHQL
eukprot:TRINITY_DN2442_c0_g1_i2.p1 TRINITY_DN2442_c0_g1~~TRINITY_DN2442_c0_g1_i2.p1  ORF type:complete len:404 (-),score=83.53 TRINITY_DN2442_c0_g1_i2:21-1232(-)